MIKKYYIIIFIVLFLSFSQQTFARYPCDGDDDACNYGYCCNRDCSSVTCISCGSCSTHPAPNTFKQPTAVPVIGGNANPTTAPVPPAGAPTPTPIIACGNAGATCDIDCSSGATSSYWQAREWPSNDPKCCSECGRADWCQYNGGGGGWSCSGNCLVWSHETRTCPRDDQGHCSLQSSGWIAGTCGSTPQTSNWPNCPTDCSSGWGPLCEQSSAPCPPAPTLTPTPYPCRVDTLTAITNSCDASTFSLNYTASYPERADSFQWRYHDGSCDNCWSGFSTLSSNPYTTNTLNYIAGGYNFEACCSKDGVISACQQAGAGMEACPTPTPICNPATNLTGSCAGSSGPIILNWTDSNNETYYYLSRRVNDVWSYEYINPINQNSITVNDTDVGYNKYNNSYNYNVWSCCGNASNCKYSNQPHITCPTPTPVKASCTGSGIAPQPAIDGKSVTYTKGTSTAGWNWGIKYQYNALVPDQNTLCANNPDTTCILNANLSSGRDLYFGTNLSKTIDGTTYYCRFDGTWIPNAPNSNPESTCTNACTYGVNIITPTPTNTPPLCGTITYSGAPVAEETVSVTAPGTDPNLNQTLTYNWTKTCGTLASTQTTVPAVRPQSNSPSAVDFTCPADGSRCIVNATVGDGAATSNCTGVNVCGCGPIPIPSLNSPANNYCTKNTSIPLSATGASTYQFAVDNENTFSSPWLYNSGWDGASVTASTTPPLTTGTYYWTARTTINQDVCDGNFATPRKLMIDTNPLSKVTDRPIYCQYDGATDSYKVQYSWDTINYTGLCGFDKYLIQVWSDTTNQNYYYNTTTNTNSPWITVPANITISAHTKAYDKAIPDANESPWSNGTSLVINYENCGRDIPAPIPTCGVYNSGATPITWTWTSGATGLQVKDTYSFASGGGTAANWLYNAPASSGKVINGVAPGTIVYGRVTNDFATFSPESSVTCPTPIPTNTPTAPILSCVVNDTTIAWSWTASAPPPADGKYWLQVGTGSAANGNVYNNGETPGLAADTMGLSNNTTYYGHVTGTDGTPWSNEISCTTAASNGTYLKGRIWYDVDEDFRRSTDEQLLTSAAPFVDMSFSYDCGGRWSGSITNDAVNDCEHENGTWNPGRGPYQSSWIPKASAVNCSITATINSPEWYFVQPKNQDGTPKSYDAGGWRVYGDTMCPNPPYPCSCSFEGWSGTGGIYSGSNLTYADGKVTKFTVTGVDASTQSGNIWFAVNRKLPVPTGSCGTYASATETTPVTWTWSGATGIQVKDTTDFSEAGGSWWYNTSATSPLQVHHDVNNTGATPGIPPGRPVYARTTNDFITDFSESGTITCPTPTGILTPTPTPTPTPTVPITPTVTLPPPVIPTPEYCEY